jgi:glycosyltransferase involved in cell wall biosynthesis
MPLVSVLCTAYNHEPFIEKSLLGMLKQKTSFAYEIIVHDDASTDGTKKIVEEYWHQYPHKIKPIFQQDNQFSKGRKIWTEIMIPQAKGKYIAICDGDDWWTDENKLQMQVDFLDNNPEYSICWTGYEVNNGEKTEPAEWLDNMHYDEDVDQENAFHPYRTYTLTAVMKRNSIDVNIYNALKYHKDNSLYAICLTKGKGRLMKMITGVYNVHSGGMFSKKSSQYKALNSYLNFKEISSIVFSKKNKSIKLLRNYFLKESIVFSSFRLNRLTFLLLKDALLFLSFLEIKRLLWRKLVYRN